MATIEKLHKNGEVVYPQTKSEAVLDEDNTSVQTRINEGVFFQDPEEAHSSAYVDTSAIVDGAVTKQKIAWSAILNYIYPIGSIYMSATLSTPTQVKNALGGGTWEAWGAGKVPVGVDTTQTEFNTVGKTGGEKTHKHSSGNMEALIGSPSGNASALGFAQSSSLDTGSSYPSTYSVGGTTSQASGHPRRSHNTKVLGDTTEVSTLQPYITCYMYRRTA